MAMGTDDLLKGGFVMNRWGMRIGLVLVVMWVFLAGPSPALAALTCQTEGSHQLCLETAKRSAKYFWQYQAVVTVDGQPLPTQRYDCRPPAPAPSMGAEAGDAVAKESALAAAEIQSFVCRAVMPRR